MTKICYILLCHKNADAVVEQVGMLTGAGSTVSIHVDANAPREMHQRLREAFSGRDDVVFARSVRCGWGEWSLVRASLGALRKAEASFPEATHFYLISGDCMPIKSAATLEADLSRNDRDVIEVNDFLESGWIKVGLKEERLVYRHLFNERTQKRRFYASMALQKRLGMERALPEGVRVMIGSQWWCLRRRTVEKILSFLRKRPDMVRFFRTTWIPDETFFQTLVAHLVARDEIDSRPPTFLLFSDYGMPVNFQNDHYDLLIRQKGFFARKLSPNARALRTRLATLFADPAVQMGDAENGASLFSYVSSRGRNGQRFGERIWVRQSHLGRARRVHVIACKKWHVAKRFAQAITDAAEIPSYGYLFNEVDAGLPDLGNAGSTLAKRERNRRAFLRLLFEATGVERMVICIDPASIEALRELREDAADVRLLEIQCAFTDGYLVGHADRMGLGTGYLNEDMRADLLTTLRANIDEESEALGHLGFPTFERVDEHGDHDEIAPALMRFLDIDADTAFRAAHQGRFNQLGSAHVQL